MLYSLMGKMRLSFKGSDLLYRGALEGSFDCILFLFVNKMNKKVIIICKMF